MEYIRKSKSKSKTKLTIDIKKLYTNIIPDIPILQRQTASCNIQEECNSYIHSQKNVKMNTDFHIEDPLSPKTLN